MGISTVFNVGLDLLFILILDMGVAGAALATVLSEGGAGIFCFVWLLKKYPILRPEEDEKRLRLSYMGKVVFMSVPMGLQYSVTAIGAVILQTSINELGEVAVAAYSIGSKVKSLFFCPLNAMGSALATFTGQNYGYGDMKRVRRGIRSTIVMGVLYCILVIAVAMTASTVLAGLFVDAWTNSLLRVYAIQNLMSTNGIINTILVNLHISTDFAVYFGMVFTTIPFMILPLYSNMQKIDTSVLEAGRDLGATNFQLFWKVIFPVSLPGLSSGIVLVFIPAMANFFITDMLGGGKSINVGNVIQSQFSTSNNWPMGSAVSIVLRSWDATSL